MDSLRLTPVIIIGLKIFFYQVIILLGTVIFPDILYAEIGAIAPGRTITVVADQPDVPEWKTLWDKARQNVRENRYQEASRLYNQLLKVKPNIEEANWEYCKVLLKGEDYSSAVKIILPLVEKDPLRIDYLLAAGMISLHQQNYTLAVKYYGKVYEMNPGGTDSTSALGGLIDSLKGKGSDDTIFPLLEQLHVMDPGNMPRLYELARMARLLEKTEKAKMYYAKLLDMDMVDDRILLQAAELFEDEEDQERVVPLWQEYIKRNPNYLPFRKNLIEFYLAKKEGMAALPHLLFIENKAIENDNFQLQIAEIYLHDGGRPDKALSYYEKYLLKNPDDQTVRSNISNIQSILANDFLAIVENDGAWLLWRDLMEVTPNRVGIYLKMATLLEKKGKLGELLEILSIISYQKPHDDKINYKIADLYRQKKEYIRALNYLEKITASFNSTKKHYLLKGNIEELAGYEQKALTSYRRALNVDNTDLNLRKDCITKAGALGMVEELEKFFVNNPVSLYNREHIDFILNYLDQLSYNYLFDQLAVVYEYFLDIFKNDREIFSKLQFHRVDSFRQQGKLGKAEELLRKLSNDEQSEIEALFRLTLNAIEDRDIQASRAWYSAFGSKIETDPPPEEKNVLQMKKVQLKVKILLATGELQDAAYLIIDLKKHPLQKPQKSSYESVVYQLEKELCWQYLGNDKYFECEEILKGLHGGEQFDPELMVIQNILRRESEGIIAAASQEYELASGEQPIISRLLQVVKVELQHEEYISATKHLDAISNIKIDSLVSQLLSAELSVRNGGLNKAVALYKTLYERFAKEKYFLKKWVINVSKRGNYEAGIAALLQSNERLHYVDAAVMYSDLSNDFEEVLIFARMLWGDKQLEKSLKVYELLLNPPVIDLLGKRFEVDEIYFHYFSREKSFWNSLRYLMQTKPEIVAELMAPPFLIDNLGNESGKIVVDYYDLYRWQKLVMNEYLARKAIVQRNYVIAERKYKRLLGEEEENTEGLADLASIYDRFGQYRKEAQVYEVMRNSGVASAELEEAIEKSTAEIRPHSGLEGDFLTKSGREGSINLENRSLGASLMFTPDLEKDISFLYLRNNYSKTDESGTVSGFFLESTGTIELLSDTDFLFGAQAERFSGKAGTNYYYSLGLRSRLDDYFSGHIEGYKKKVDDTLDAIVAGIYSDGFKIGLIGETTGGLIFGGDYRHRYYSDGNSQDQFHGYSSYNIYGEDIHFSVQYDYQYLENSDSSKGKIGSEEKTNGENDLYWKPDRYSEHRMTVHFQQLIKGHYGSDGLKSFFSFDNSIGYEDPQNIMYIGKFDIFLEMTPHYLLKSNFVFINSDEYEEKSIHFSLLYRW